jgi:16S rRNA (adenine1518-N6/adenine1519-N6)-dimethyltransferase
MGRKPPPTEEIIHGGFVKRMEISYRKAVTPTEIRHALDLLGVRPRQALGQNFLHDGNLARAIVALAEVGVGECVVEIGPGLGALTGWLAGDGRRVVAIEKDAVMVRWLGERFAGRGVELFHGDAMDFDLRILWGEGPVKVVGNLPYYVSTPLVAKYTSALSPASVLVLTLQQEVARRLAAGVSHPDYGAMSVCVQRRWNVRIEKTLPPSVFYPRPKVSSAVVRLTPRAERARVALDEEHFERLVRRGFGERRKQLKNLLPEWKDRWEEICAALGVRVTARAENLDLGQWERLAQMTLPGVAQRADERFDVVDEKDRVVGTFSRDHVHVNNLRHRAVHILLFNSAGEIYLQRRTPWKDRNPGLWDSSAAGHVDAGETYAQAAERELREELGVGSRLGRAGRIGSSQETAWEFVEVFRGEHGGPFRLAGMEVETGAFFPVAQVRGWMARRPEDFTPLARLIFPRFVF